MNEPKHFSSSRLRALFLSAGMLLLLMAQACTTYSPSHGYPASTNYYQPQAFVYYPGHGYYSHRHYGSYQPGWFISSGYSGAYYGDWGYTPLTYWPGYSHSYYRHAFYPYFDPWHYSYTRYYRSPYGYRHGYGAGYRYGSPYGGNPYYGDPYYGSHPYYGNNPYYGSSHRYRPPGQNQPPIQNPPDLVVIPPGQPGQNQPPTQNRPDPVVIPPGQRGRRGASDGFNEQIDEGLRQRETYQPDRRSVTVVNEEQDLSRSVGVAPTQTGDQGMTISNRSERKIRESRLEPVGAQTIVVEPNAAQNDQQEAYSTLPVQPTAPAIPFSTGRSSRSYEPPTDAAVGLAPATQNQPPSHQIAAPAAPLAVPSRRSESVYRQAPARQQPANQQPNRQPYQQPNRQPNQQPNRQPYQQQPPSREAPGFEQSPDASNITPSADRHQPPDAEREQEDPDN